MTVFRACAAQRPGAGAQVQLVSLHACHFANTLACGQAKPKDALAVDLARQHLRQRIPQLLYLGIVQDAVATAHGGWSGHSSDWIAIEITPSHRPPKHCADIAEHAIGFNRSVPPDDGVKHAIDVASV
jgi:hypothetical protein